MLRINWLSAAALALSAALTMSAAPTPPPTTAPPTTAPATAASPRVTIDNFAFEPKELTVAPGTTVTWVNHDDVPHTATSRNDPPAFDSKTLDTDQTYSFTFTRPGTYTYYCKVHNHMTGTVIVK